MLFIMFSFLPAFPNMVQIIKEVAICFSLSYFVFDPDFVAGENQL